MESLFGEHYFIYKIAGSNVYAAISHLSSRDIRQYAAEYQGLSKVPGDKAVKGILFVPSSHTYELKVEGKEVELPINSLQFDTGDLRLSA